jgi:hypothetical protein
MWQDTRLEVGKVQTAVTANYQNYARHLRAGGVSSFVSRDSPLADPDTLGHPPGYPALVALVFAACGERDAAIQFAQIACDSLAAAVLFLLVAELLTFGAGATAGALAALSPQFAWNSVLLLPDTLAVLPLLAAVYCVAVATRRANRGASVIDDNSWRDGDDDSRRDDYSQRGDDDSRRGRLALLFAAGALVGVSCWLRANALLFAPFLAAAVALVSRRKSRARRASALLCGALVVVGALAARNAYVFRRLIPVSLGAGQTLLEGIADYDPEGRFRIPLTDLGIMREEAARHGRPDYAETLFGPDAHARDRERLARGLSVVKSEPTWFALVMARRAASMLRLERARLVSAVPPVTRALGDAESRPPDLSLDPAGLLAAGVLNSPRAQARLTAADFQSAAGGGDRDAPADSLLINGDETRRGEQFSSAPFTLRPATDYLLSSPARVVRGRVRLSIEAEGDGATLASTLVDAAEVAPGGAQPAQKIKLAFAGRDSQRARLVVRNEDPNSALQLGAVELRALGDSAAGWARIPRAVVRAAQRFFLTAVVLPLAFAGLLLVARSRDVRALALLLVVPAYYMTVQSAVHTEYRYVLAVPHFLFALSAFALARGAGEILRKVRAH